MSFLYLEILTLNIPKFISILLSKQTMLSYSFMPNQRILNRFSRGINTKMKHVKHDQTFKMIMFGKRCDKTFFTPNIFSIAIWGQAI